MAQTKKSAVTAKKPWTLERAMPWLLTIGGFIGLAMAFIITLEKLELLKNPAYTPSCDINPLINCGPVMASGQASAFGFPNPFIGLAAFAVLITIGMALFAGAKFKRWFWIGLQIGTTLGLAFVFWLFYQTVYQIGALCPYCMVVWVVVITLFVYTTLYNLRTGVIPTPKGWEKFVAFLQRHHGDILLVWFLIIVGLILNHFWYYWKTLI